HSLADQVCNLEQEEDLGKIISHSWSDIVTIYVNESKKNDGNRNLHGNIIKDALGKGEEGGEEKKEEFFFRHAKMKFEDVQPLPFASGPSKPEDLQDMLNSILPDHSVFLEDEEQQRKGDEEAKQGDSPLAEYLETSEDIWVNNSPYDQTTATLNDDLKLEMDGNVGGGYIGDGFSPLSVDCGENEPGQPSEKVGQGPKSIDYLNVSFAELSTGNGGNNQVDFRVEMVSLGLVFVELFSGGKGCTLPDIVKSGLSNDHDTPVTTPQAFSQLNMLNLASATDIIDSLGENDELFGGGYISNETSAKLFGRDAELANLKDIYLRSISNEVEQSCAIIEGPSGIGKTKLSQELVQYAMKGGGNRTDGKGCIILSGKFDKLQQAQPFSAVASAFNKYCGWLSSAENAHVAERLSIALKQELGREVHVIAKLVPDLSKIVGGKADLHKNDGVGDAQKRLRYLLCQFIEIICRSHDSPVMLWLDDLQWVDSASIALINQVLLVSRCNFFLLGCCRETKSDHPLWNMLDSVSGFGTTTARIKLDFIDKESVNSLISQKLKLMPRVTRPLADIVYHKTKGIPFFVQQLILELHKEGLLRPSLARRRWVWEEEKIFERGLPDDVVEFMTNSLNRLPIEVLSALGILSCFGASLDCSLIEKLQNEAGLSLSGPLDTAVAEGYVKKKNGMYCFVHDRVQESAYDAMDPDFRCHCHFHCGMALSTVAKRDIDDGLLLIAVGQINLAGPTITSSLGNESSLVLALKVANLNLSAAKIAMGMSDFFSAYWFFDNGISYLNNRHWENNYELTLALHNGLAECAIANGGEHTILKLKIASEQVLHYARCLEDKLNVLLIKLRVLFQQSKLPAAIEHGLDVLSQLGEVIPDEITPDVVILYLENTKAMLENISDEDLINYKVICDQKKEGAIEFLAQISAAKFQISPSDQPLIVLKMVQLSLEAGMSPLSPVAFALYGSFVASTGDIREGYRFAKISQALLNRQDVGSRRNVEKVLAYTGQIIAYVEPIQSVAELHAQGHKAGMTSGTTSVALFNSLLEVEILFWSGMKSLSKTISSLGEFMRSIKQQKHLMLTALSMPFSRTVSTLHHGSLSNSVNDADDGFSSKMEEELRQTNPAQSRSFYFHKMFIAFMFRDFSRTQKFAVKYLYFKIGVWMIFFHQSMHLFYEGLVGYWIGREESSAMWMAKGNESKVAMQKFAACSKWNFENKFYLLSAEEQFCERNFELAAEFYDKAISSAKEHRFVNEEALSNELAGMFYLETGRRSKSIAYFSRAIEKYHTRYDQLLQIMLKNS
ncbi:hypothetical protein ACHAXR_009250, partial [Thalassiosira sp. AJA248-18]